MKKIKSVFIVGHGAKILDKILDVSLIQWNNVLVYKDDECVGVCYPFMVNINHHNEINADLFLDITEKDLQLFALPVLSHDEDKIILSRINLVNTHPNKEVVNLFEYRKIGVKMTEIENSVAMMKRKGWSQRRILRAIKNME